MLQKMSLVVQAATCNLVQVSYTVLGHESTCLLETLELKRKKNVLTKEFCGLCVWVCMCVCNDYICY